MATCLALTLLFSNELAILMQSGYSTGVGKRKTVYFDDGSTAMLNTDSAITVSMDGPHCQVELLKGEIYFKVKSDPSRPFIVQAEHSTLSTTWVNGFLVFENAPLESIINQIRRYRAGVVVYKDNTL